MTTDRWGIDTQWVDARGRSRAVADRTLRQLRDLIGEPPAGAERQAPVVTSPGGALGADVAGEVVCEDGSARWVGGGVLPRDVPLGYHWLHSSDGARRRLIVSPGRCWLPAGWRAWGLAVQLYAARSRASWGIGDLGDLRSLREWLQGLGGGFVLVNPLLAVAPTLPQEASPYLPATRRWRNPIYLRVDMLPGGEPTDVERNELRDLQAGGRIDRDRVWALKRAVLERAFRARRPADDEFETWRAQQGSALHAHATWCALADAHGADWRDWSAPLQRPDAAAVARFAAEHAVEIAFHSWLQWQLDQQLVAASSDVIVIQDLPIGVAGGGSDAWTWQAQLASGVEVGAPPDVFSPDGQAWGSPPFIPWRLRQADYEPFVQAVRGTITGAGGMRIDHVMGLFRLWWVPPGGTPVDGAYVRYPSRDLLDIVALESHRARALVVGEDLGTVEPGVRETLAARGLLSYKLVWFEAHDPADWPSASMAAVTTHDLPTVSGLWGGLDLHDQRRYGTGVDDELRAARGQLRRRLRQRTGLAADASVDEAVIAAHRLLARAPSTLLTATLEDLVAQRARPNLPGATQRPNWSLPLPVLVDDLPTHPLVAAVTGVFASALTGGTADSEAP